MVAVAAVVFGATPFRRKIEGFGLYGTRAGVWEGDAL